MEIDSFAQGLILSPEDSLDLTELHPIGADRQSHASIFTDLSEKNPYFLSVECLYSRNPEPTIPHSLGVKLAKFMLSLRDESFELLQTEAEDRGISIQELIRAVIIHDWVKVNTAAKTAFDNGNNGLRAYRSAPVRDQEQVFQSAMSRIR